MRFAIIASARTGSSLLTSLLHAHDDIFCNGEIFHPQQVFLRWPKKEKTPELMAELEEMRRQDPVRFMNHVISRSYGRPFAGFKIFEGHNDPVLEHILSNTDIKKIVLLRRNVLAVYSSTLIARQTGEFYSQGPRTIQKKIEFRRKKFLNFSDNYLSFYRRVLETLSGQQQPFYVVDYEQLNDRWLLGGVINFIGARPPAGRLSTGHIRQNSSAILDRFENPEAVEAFLKDNDLLGWRYESPMSLDPLGLADMPVVMPDTKEKRSRQLAQE